MQIGIRALDESLNLQKKKKPLIHCISNYVAQKELIEGILSFNGRPLLSNNLEESIDITDKCDCLFISLENIEENKIDSIEKSIRLARRRKIPIILDIIGINLSFSRKETALSFINRYHIDVISGRIEDFKIILESDNIEKSKINCLDIKNNIDVRVSLRAFSKQSTSIVVIQYENYYITDGYSEFYIKGELTDRRNILGIENILIGLIAVGVASARNNEEKFKGVLVAIMTMAVSEKNVVQKSLDSKESNKIKEYLLEEIRQITSEKINKIAKVDYFFVR